MRRTLHIILLGLLGAGVVHLTILLLIPQFSERDAWSQLAEAADLYTATPFDEAGGPSGADDPLFRTVACRFNLGDGMVQVSAPEKVLFWSMSVYDRSGHDLYSFNDRASTNGLLNAVILTPGQMIEVRKELPEEFEGSVFVETPIREGIVVVRGFVPDDSWSPVVAKFLKDISCTPEQFGS